jgi:hypothetical protein
VDPRVGDPEADARFTSEGSWLRIDAKDWRSLPEACPGVSRARRSCARARAAHRAGSHRADLALPGQRPHGRRIELPAVSNSAATARVPARPLPGTRPPGEIVC